MRLSAQISTFAVLVLAIVAFGLYVNSVDIDTDVRNQYVWDVQGPVSGFSFNVPPTWKVEKAGESARLSHANGAFLLTAEQAQTEGAAPSDLLDSAADATQTDTAYNGHAAVQALTESPEGVTVHEVVQLSPTGSAFLHVRSEAPISPDHWSAINRQLTQILSTLSTDNLEVAEAVFTTQAPDNWLLVDEGANTVTLITPADASMTTPQEAQFLFGVVLPQQAYTFVTQFGPPADTTLTDPIAILDELETNLTPTLTLLQPVTEISYGGHTGRQFAFSDPTNGQDVFVVVLDPQDGYIVIALGQSNAGTLDTYTADYQAMLDSLVYNTPDPEVFAPASGQ